MTITPLSEPLTSNPASVCDEGRDAPDAPVLVSPACLVVKVGTSTLTNAQGRIDRAFIADLTAQMARLRAQGCDVVLVTSGAIRAGREALATASNIPAPDTLPYKQASAAIGQGLLMHTYTEAFAWRDVTVAQILLTRDDLSDPARFANAQNTLRALLALGVIPIINENDTVAVEEIKFGDNDTLAALVATLVGADLLLILSDVEGLYARGEGTGNREQGTEDTGAASNQGVNHEPRTGRMGRSQAGEDTNHEPPIFSPDALISVVSRIDAAIVALAGGVTSGVGTGGMRTKIEAARIATNAGIRTVIARGRRDRVIEDVAGGQSLGTTFLPQATKQAGDATA